MPDDVRLAALQSGADAAGDAQYVAIRTEDLRWLLAQLAAVRGDESQPSLSDIADLN